MLSALRARIEKTVEKFHTLLGGMHKEMRQFPVHVSKELSALASFDCGSCPDDEVESETGNRWYEQLPLLEVQGRAAWILDFALDGIYMLLDNRRFCSRVDVPIKITKSVRTPSGDDLRSRITRECAASVENMEHILGLHELLSLIGVPSDDLLERACYDEFLREAADMFARSVEIPLLSCTTLQEAFKKRWHRRRLLAIKMKVYLSRADERAFIVSSDAIASVTGAIVQQFLIPKRKDVYAATGYGQSVSKRGGNVLDIRVPVHHTASAHLVLLDIMGFTGSNVNSSVLTLVVAHWLNSSKSLKHLRGPKLFSVQGEYFEAELADVFVQYLYRTLLADVALPGGATFSHVGGYLGIPGNMAMCMYACIIEMKMELQSCVDVDVQYILKPGGDDIALILIGHLEDVVKIEQQIHTRLTKYVGSLKEFVIHDLPVGIISEAVGEFCKKDVVASRSQTELSITSVTGFPITKDLLERKPLKDALMHADRFVSMCLNSPLACDSNAFEAYLRGYEKLHNVSIRTIPGPRANLPEELQFERLDGKLFSQTAYQIIAQIPAIRWRGVAVRSTTQEKVDYALRAGLLVRLQFSNAVVYDSTVERACVVVNSRTALLRIIGPEADSISRYVDAAFAHMRELSY